VGEKGGFDKGLTGQVESESVVAGRINGAVERFDDVLPSDRGLIALEPRRDAD